MYNDLQIKSKNKGSEYMKCEKCSKCESCEKSTHRTEEEKKSLTKRLNIIEGQIRGIKQMIEDDRYCVDISNQLLATQALLKSANQEIMQAHIRSCVAEALQTDKPNPKLEEALSLLEKMSN